MTETPLTDLHHGSAVKIGDWAVMLCGPSGAGKSDLALRLMDTGAQLVSDDQVILNLHKGIVMAAPPQTIAGQIEVRGLGVISVSFAQNVPLALVIDLVAPEAVERLPDAGFCPILGVEIPRLAMTPFEASAPAKIRAALRSLLD